MEDGCSRGRRAAVGAPENTKGVLGAITARRGQRKALWRDRDHAVSGVPRPESVGFR